MRNRGCVLLHCLRRNAFCSCRKGSLGESFVEIESEDIVAVRGYAKIGVGLARRRPDDSQQLFFLEGVNPLNRQGGYSCLLAFLHREADKQISFFALVIIFYTRRD